ncbi:hypothetical protein [Brucella intermedia]|uniref:hypothetical protein n=1 Tax=Brucella intermedia TaxID=94625 RepID=UPI00224B3FE6|nr:hypothetical protein [Brucella intermedia]
MKLTAAQKVYVEDLDEMLVHNAEMKQALAIHQERDARIWNAIGRINDAPTRNMMREAYRGQALKGGDHG